MTFHLKSEADGLSFAARAVLATVAALVVEHQHDQVPAKCIMECLAFSRDVWTSARDELFEAGVLFAAHDPSWTGELVSLVRGGGLLQSAMGSGGRPSAKDWAELVELVFSEKGRECVYCDAPAATIDHVVPVARGGSNHHANLVPACKTCNSAKGARLLLEEWTPPRLVAR
jgi:hypothetical protein